MRRSFRKASHSGLIASCAAALLCATQLFAAQSRLATSAGSRPIGAKRTTLSVVVLDALNTDWGSQIYARDAVREMIETLPPGNRIAIYALDDQLHLLHDFSSDTASLLAAVNGYDGAQPFWGVGHGRPVNPIAAQFSSEEVASGVPPIFDAGPVAFAREQRILSTLDAMTSIAQIMGNAQGLKYLLWISSAFPAISSDHQLVAQTTRTMSRAGLVLYAVDPRGVLQSFAAEANVDTMKEFADQTGGRTYYNNNDVASLLRVAIAVLSNSR